MMINIGIGIGFRSQSLRNAYYYYYYYIIFVIFFLLKYIIYFRRPIDDNIVNGGVFYIKKNVLVETHVELDLQLDLPRKNKGVNLFSIHRYNAVKHFYK